MTSSPFKPTSRHGPRLLPSVETQTVAFVEHARALNARQPVSQWLSWGGFRVYLRYWRQYEVGGEVLDEVLVLANIEIHERFRGRGWYWRYCQLCCALVQDGVILELVQNDQLMDAISRQKAFTALGGRNFLLRKQSWGDWPLSLTPGRE